MILALWALLLSPGPQEEREAARVRALLRRLARPDEDARRRSLGALKKVKVTPGVGVLLLRAAAADYPDGAKPPDLNETLLNLIEEGHPDYLPVLEEVYDRFEGKGNCRESALHLLAEMQSEASLALLVRLLARPSSRTVDLSTPFGPIRPSAALSPRLFPGLLEAAPHVARPGPIYRLVLDFAREGFLDLADYPGFVRAAGQRVKELAAQRAAAFDRWAPVLDRVEPDPEEGGVPEDLRDEFFQAEVLADLLGSVGGPEVEDALRPVLALKSLRLRAFAAGSLLRRQAEVAGAALEEVASSPTGRAVLWDALEGAGRLDAFPRRYRTQAYLAEANLVDWLQFPTEFGCAPQQIRRLAVVRAPDEDLKPALFYFFAYRRASFDEGKWLVGVAGPYPEKGPPTAHGRRTFSRFTALDDKDLDGHIREYVDARLPYNVVEK